MCFRALAAAEPERGAFREKTIHLEFVKYTLMSKEEAIIIISIIITFYSDTHCVSNFKVYSILLPVHQPLTFMYFRRSG